MGYKLTSKKQRSKIKTQIDCVLCELQDGAEARVHDPNIPNEHHGLQNKLIRAQLSRLLLRYRENLHEQEQ